jgi:uncharacterized coiled-coil protein SlyX
MKTRSITTMMTFALLISAVGFAFADVRPGAMGRGRPTVADVQANVSKTMAIKNLRAKRGQLVGPVAFGVCAAAKSAETAYEACEDRCADWAAQQPITIGDLVSCGDEMSAADCANKLVDVKSRECIRMAGNPGCRDEQTALIRARQACQECKAETAKIAELNKKKAANDVEIAGLLKQLAAAKAEAQQLDDELDKLGNACKSTPVAPKPATPPPTGKVPLKRAD